MKKMLAATLMLAVPFFMALSPIQAGEASQASSALPGSNASTSLEGKYAGYNVVLIILDVLRPDFLSCYGYPRKTSPHIDALARQGVVFENAFSESSLTFPSLASMFTSLYPQSHGIRSILKDKVGEKIYTLAQILTFYDYDTAWFGLLWDPHTSKAEGLLRGFKEKYAISEGGIVSWVHQHRKNPFFITIHSYAAHPSLFLTRRFDNEFSRNVSPEFKVFFDNAQRGWWKDLREWFRAGEGTNTVFEKDWAERYKAYFEGPFSAEKLQKIFELAEDPQLKYKLHQRWLRSCFSFILKIKPSQRADFFTLLDASIFNTDEKLIGPLLRELNETKILDKTLIIIASAHGNEFGEHGHAGHGEFLYDETIHVPLIMYAPGLLKPSRKSALVENADLLPSILQLLKIPLPHQAQGVSFVDVIQKKEGAVHPREFVFAESISGAQSIRSLDWKYIQNSAPGTGNELFDLRNDPLEKKNVINENERIAEDLEKKLNNWKAGLTVYAENKGEFSAEIDEQTRENIRKTGYW